MASKDDLLFIKKHYPNSSTKEIAAQLNLTTSKVRSLAERNHIKKCPLYKEKLKTAFIESRRKWYESSIPEFKPTHIQEQIIFGSLLGDGYVSKGAQRSINYYYQEHFGQTQREYRLWKLAKLQNLGFSINGNYLRSKSHPYFTNLHPILYPKGLKSLRSEFISKCTHPIFLATLYLDDGTLIFSHKYNSRKHVIYCHPCIILYTLNLTRDENLILADHLNQTFNVNFVVSGHPDGNGSLLKINKEGEVRQFLTAIAPYVKDIKSMAYKTSINHNLNSKVEKIKNKYGNDVTIKLSSSTRNKAYSNQEINTIIQLKKEGNTDEFIANRLGRTYWSVVYKLSELRKQQLI